MQNAQHIVVIEGSFVNTTFAKPLETRFILAKVIEIDVANKSIAGSCESAPHTHPSKQAA